MNRSIFSGSLWTAAFGLLCTQTLSAQTKTLDDKSCHVTIPSNWMPVGPRSAQAPGAKTLTAVVRSIDAGDYKLTVDMVKQGQMASVNAKILDDNPKRVLIQTEAKGAGGKTTTHYQVMTKGSPSCQGSSDFEDPADAATARKIVESTTGAQ